MRYTFAWHLNKLRGCAGQLQRNISMGLMQNCQRFLRGGMPTQKIDAFHANSASEIKARAASPHYGMVGPS
jgi:hypothetical protein